MKLHNFLGYHKSKVKNWLNQLIIINRFRLIGAIILSETQIAKGTILYPDNKIGHHSGLDQNVIMSPGVSIGNYTKISNIQIGENSIIESWVGCTGHGEGKIIIGKESYIGISNILDWSDNIIIGNFVHIAGPSTGLWTHSSSQMCLNGIPLKDKGKCYRPTAPISIGDNVYIGGNCTIYPGVKIGHHSIIAPNSAVTKDVPPFALYGGVPATFIKNIHL